MSENSLELNQKIEKLKADYGVWLATKLDILLADRVLLVERTASAEQVEEMESLIHELAGTGAMFGFEKVTKSARTLKTRMEERQPGDDIARLVPLLDNVIAIIRAGTGRNQ